LHAVDGHLISAGPWRAGYFGQCPTVKSCARKAWVNYVGRADQFGSSFHNSNWKLSSNGVQLGTDLLRTRRSQFGVLFGYENAKSTNVRDEVKMDDIYLGAYGAYIFNSGVDARAIFAFGWQSYDAARLSAADQSFYASSFKGNTTETNLELGKRFWSGCWSFRPVGAIDIMTNSIKGATETGGARAVTFDKTDLTQVFLRTGTDLRYQMNRFTLNSGIYYAYNVNDSELTTTVRNAGGAQARLIGTDLGKSLLMFNAGGDYQLARNWSIFGGYNGNYATDSAAKALQSTAYVGTGFKW